MTPEEFRAAGHVLIDWIADHRTRVPDLPVRATVAPGEVAAGLAASAPASPEPFAAVLADLEQVVVPGITQTQSPHFYGWFPSNAALASVLGDIASSGLGALGITWQSAPALTEVEQVVTEWLRVETGLGPQWRGAIHDTASTACLVALLAARERATGHGQTRGGLAGVDAPLIVYTSPHAHSSVAKAVALAGFGLDHLRRVDVEEATLAMRPEALAAAMAADSAAGLRPAAVVASVGTTATTAIDPVGAIVDVAARHGAWVHVDAAMAGSALLLPEWRPHAAGIEGADSLGWNPHKWMGTILDCSLLYLKDVDHLIRVMSTDPSYLRSAADGEVVQYKDWGIPLGRRFRALKLWFHLRLDGLDAIRARLRRDLENAAWLAAEARTTPGWSVLAPVPLQTVCLRHTPEHLAGDDDAVDAHTLAWAERLNASGRAFVTPALLDGRWMVRVSVGAEPCELEHVRQLWDFMQVLVRSEGMS